MIELISQAKAGDKQALLALCRYVEPAIKAGAYKVLGRRPIEDHEEVRSSAMLAFIEGLSRMKSANPKGFAYKIATQQAMRYLSKVVGRGPGTASIDDESGLLAFTEDDCPSPEMTAIRRQLIESLSAELNRVMTPQQEQVYKLVLIGGLKPAEAAESLGVTPVHIRQVVHQIRKKVKEILAELERGPP